MSSFNMLYLNLTGITEEYHDKQQSV